MIRSRSGRLAAGAVVTACVLPGPAPAVAQVPGASHGLARSTTDSTLEDAAWLAGCWRTESPDGRNATEEQWMAPRGGLMVGMSRSVRDDEARAHELLTIRVAAEGLVYHAAPSGQTPTDFPARSVEEGRLEFVNADHDFPQKIVYTPRAAHAAEAAVFGEADDPEPAFTILYQRVRCPGS